MSMSPLEISRHPQGEGSQALLTEPLGDVGPVRPQTASRIALKSLLSMQRTDVNADKSTIVAAKSVIF
jgi:hypothetical protein